MKKKIVVTQRDIDNGRAGSFCECPIALAVRRAFRVKPDRVVAVRHEGIFVGDLEDERMWLGDVDWEVERFISRFDQGRTVKPATFSIAFK